MLTFASDACLAECLDDRGRPVPDGVASSRVLVTNLHNLTQPLIRYELTDRFTPAANPGAGFLRASVDGRADDLFRYPAASVHPFVIGALLLRAPAVREFQVRQTEPRRRSSPRSSTATSTPPSSPAPPLTPPSPSWPPYRGWPAPGGPARPAGHDPPCGGPGPRPPDRQGPAFRPPGRPPSRNHLRRRAPGAAFAAASVRQIETDSVHPDDQHVA